MAKLSDKTMRELEDILNGSETYGDRLAAFLKLKTTAKPQSNTPFVLGGFDVTFDVDVDVDLVKLPPKPLPEAAAEEQPQQKTTKNAIVDNEANSVREIQPPPPVAAPPSPARENVQRPVSPTNSPRRSLRRSGGGSVPGSDRLRRVAINRRSRSLGRRDLLREFNDAAANTSKSPRGAAKEISNSASSTLNFLPGISSTPASAKQEKLQATAAASAKQDEQQATAATAAPAVENLLLQDQNKTGVITQSRKEVALISTSQRSLASPSASQHHGVTQRTYTVEMGPEPGQLLLSPSNKNNSNTMQQQRISYVSPSRSACNTSLRQSQLQQRPSSQSQRISHMSPSRSPCNTSLRQSQLQQPLVVEQEILVPDTPPRVFSKSLREPEFTVPESQPVMQQVLQTLTSSPVASPFVVVPISCVNPKHIKEGEVQKQATPTAPVATVASRSIQTSCSPRFVQNVAEIMTDDDSDDQRESSSAPLNLAPPGGNTTRQRRLRNRKQRVKSPNQLLDLHYSRSKDSHRARNRTKRQTVLNKPSSRPINGEEFAQELARMSNYEILDLRKRNSRGMVNPLNGHREELKEQRERQVIEERIEWELIRRNLEKSSPNRSTAKVPLPAATPRAMSPVTSTQSETISNPSPAAPPVGYRDDLRHQVSPMQQQHQRRSRLRHREMSRLEKTSMSTSTVVLSPAPPPYDFRDSLRREERSVYHQKTPKKRRGRPRRREPTLSEDELLAVCTPPTQFRQSRSRQQEQSAVLEPDMPVLADPPKKFRKSWSRQHEQSAVLEPDMPVLADPPKQFRQSRQQEQSAVLEPDMPVLADPPKQFRQSKLIQQEPIGVEDPDLSKQQKQLTVMDPDVSALPEPPDQFRWSKTMQVEVQPDKTVLADPPAQFRQSKTRQQEQMAVVEQDVTVVTDPTPQLRLSKSSQHKQLIIRLPKSKQVEPIGVEELSKHQELLSDVDIDLIALANPSPIQLSKAKQRKIKVREPGLTALGDPPTQYIDAVRSSVEDVEQQHSIDLQFNNDAAQISSHEEEPLPMETSALPALLVETVLNELPSTSKVTQQEISQMSQPKSHKKKLPEKETTLEKQAQPAVDVFKKPMAPAPRSKRNPRADKSKRELDNLRIMLANETLAPEETMSASDLNATGVRKSRRGQVPLRNTWVHTQSDPFAFMRKAYEKSFNVAPTKLKKQVQSGANSTDLLMHRPPLFSSTPRIAAPSNSTITTGKRKRGQQSDQELQNYESNQIQISGISALSSIAEHLDERPPEKPEERPEKQPPEQPEEQPRELLEEQPLEQPVEQPSEQPEEQFLKQPTEKKTEPKKRGRKKKVKIVETNPAPEDAAPRKQKKNLKMPPESQNDQEPEPMPLSTLPTNYKQNEIESEPEFHPTPLSMNRPQDHSFPLMNWLRDVEDGTISTEGCNAEEENESLVISRATNLQFSNLNGIDYAFYSGENNSCSVGYMRFKPRQVRGLNRAKYKLLFVALYGQFKIEINSEDSKENGKLIEEYIINTGDFVEIKKGCRYNITNNLDEICILLINRK